MEPDRPHNQRRGDTLQNKILKLAGLIIAISVIIGAVVETGKVKFVTREESTACHVELQARDNRIQEQVTGLDKTQAVIIEKLDAQKEMLTDIRRRLP